MLLSRTPNMLGATVVASALLLGAGCSAGGEGAVPYSQLFNGVTYKGEPIIPAPQEDMEEMLEAFLASEAEGYEEQLDPPECAELYSDQGHELDLENLSLDKTAFGAVKLDNFSVRVYSENVYVNPEEKKTPQDDPELAEACQDFSVTSDQGTIHIHVEPIPFKGNTDRGYAHKQVTESDGMEYEGFYTAAWKNDAFVTLYHSAVDQESIDAGFETLNMVLDRL